MANITINEVSQNYTYNIGNNSYATVATPIAACWGPGYFYSGESAESLEDVLEKVAWRRYPATQAGMEAFVADYRGPEAYYKAAKDFSYYQCLTYLSAGYDVLVCRVSSGAEAHLQYDAPTGTTGGAHQKVFDVYAKYPGTFGNSLLVTFTPKTYYSAQDHDEHAYWMATVYVQDASGYRNAVESFVFASAVEDATDSIPYIDDVESAFVVFKDIDYSVLEVAISIQAYNGTNVYTGPLKNGSDGVEVTSSNVSTIETRTAAQITRRFTLAGRSSSAEDSLEAVYKGAIAEVFSDSSTVGFVKLTALYARELHYTMAADVIKLLTDKLAYNPDVLVLPGWDDIDFAYLEGIDPSVESSAVTIEDISPLHAIMLDTAYFSRCAVAYLDIPRSIEKKDVYDYAQVLSRYQSTTAGTSGPNAALFNTNGALIVPWGQYRYVGTGRNNIANPAFESLMIERAMILNQAAQYWWALPTNRRHNLKLGKLDYDVSKKYLDKWQSLEGVGVNVITNIPELGLSVWGNSTLYEVPPATYQALANLSTRKLFNSIEDLVYKVGISITFAYNNDQAYSKFYAGVTPLLDTMKNVGAIDGYYVKMAADINGLDQVNANTVVGKIYLIVNGVINDIVVDLIALPPGSDLSVYA